ncbi:MAG: sulfate transporter [Vampirovibrio sp.]|jgi:SulP family sulfate permease|nr:sulfate transporter [Vampirovibrio sp.]
MGIPEKQAKPPALFLIKDQRFEAYQKPNGHLSLLRDALAGLIVALVAIPLGIGFAIASGLQPEQGIASGALAGILGGFFGGSKYQVYGPTAAFIPLLSGITSQYDTPFLILASIIAGLLIVLMGILRWGKYFAHIPFSVTVGFTVGIAMSIALGQMPDTLGSTFPLSHHPIEKIQQLGAILMQPNLFALGLAILSFLIIRFSYKTSVFIPGPLIAILISVFLNQSLFPDQMIPLLADKFGPVGGQILKVTLPALGERSVWMLISPVLSIVFIASLESVLSARMADRLANDSTPFAPNRELLGQGIINTLVPVLNGFPCTGAFARTATNIKAGAMSPAASLFQGVLILILTFCFIPFIGKIPMACIGGLLIYVAIHMVKMEEIQHVVKQGSFHGFLMLYTALVTLLTDLFIAVSSATAIFYIYQTIIKKSRSS